MEWVNETRITLRLFKGGDESRHGLVSTLAISEHGTVEMMSLELLVDEAIALATTLAAFKEQDVDVFDPDGLWPVRLGPLQDS